MKRLLLVPAFAVLGSCDHIDAVGDKVNELKDVRKESTHGVEGMDLKAIVDGIQHNGPAVQDIGEVDFQTFISEPGRLNVVVYYADYCGACKQLWPRLSGAIQTNPGRARLGRIHTDRTLQLSQEQGVRAIPDVRFYIDGKLVHKFIGSKSKENLESLIATHSANIDSTAAEPLRPRPSTAKPIEEAMEPMSKDWLPPGMSRK